MTVTLVAVGGALLGFQQKWSGEMVLHRQQRLSSAELSNARIAALEEILNSMLTAMDLYLTTDQPMMLPGLLDHARLAKREIQNIGGRGDASGFRENLLDLSLLLHELETVVRKIAKTGEAVSPEQLDKFDDLSMQLVDRFETVAIESRAKQAVLERELRTAAGNEQAAHLIFTLTFFLGVVLLLAWLLRRISKPLVTLTRDASRSIECQQPFQPTVRGAQEIVELSGTLGRVINTLEQAVEERTSQLAKETRHLEQEISRRAEAEQQLIHARDAAEEANRAKSAFLAMMSHEIRTPMNSIIGFSELLRQTQLQAEQADFTSHIHDNAEALLSLLNDVLDFSKIEAGRLSIEEEEFELLECIEKSMDVFVPRAAEKNLELILKEIGKLPKSFLGDKHRVRQVLVNLLGNAVKFTESGVVELSVKATEFANDSELFHLEFEVRDTGIGIAPEQVDRLFRPFSQADSSTSRRYGGTGLGLAICRRLVELMGGQIAVRSELESGSTFQFSLPLKAVQNEVLESYPQPNLAGPALILSRQTSTARELARKLQKLGIRAATATAWNDPAMRLIKRSENWLLIVDGHFAQIADREIPTWPLPSKASGKLFVMSPMGAKPVMRNLACRHLIQPVSQRRLLGLFDPSEVKNVAPKVSFADTKNSLHRGQELKILLAEDNETNRKLAILNLEQLGYSADVVENGRLAVEAVTAHHYDILLSDIQMPELDGMSAAREIRQLEKIGVFGARPPLRIIAMTANAMIGDREKYLAAGMDDYISKPLRLAALREVLTKTPDNKSEHQESPTKEATENPEDSLREWCRELDPEQVIAMAREFLDDVPQLIDQGITSCGQASLEELNRKAHSLKGTFKIFGLSKMAALATDVEDMTRTQKESTMLRGRCREIMETIKSESIPCCRMMSEAIEKISAELAEDYQA